MKQQRKTQSFLYKIIGTIIVFTILAGASWYTVEKIGLQGRKAAEIPTTVKKINEKTDVYTIQAEYPSFGDGLEELDRKIENDVTARIDEFKRQAAENWEVMKGDLTSGTAPSESPFSFFLQWTPTQVNKRYVSFVMNVSWFPGGANMAQTFVTFNWDVQKNSPVFLSDLFPGNPDYLETVSAYVKSDLKRQFIKRGTEEKYIAQDMLEDGTSPIEKNFSLFTFNDTIITFHFPKYQVAPGADGPQEVVMKRRK